MRRNDIWHWIVLACLVFAANNLHADCVDKYVSKGKGANRKGQFDRAIEEFRKGLACPDANDSEKIRFHYYIGNQYLFKRDREGELREYNAVVDLAMGIWNNGGPSNLKVLTKEAWQQGAEAASTVGRADDQRVLQAAYQAAPESEAENKKGYDPCHVSTTDAVLIGLAGRVPQLPPGCDGEASSSPPDATSAATDQSAASLPSSAGTSEINVPHGNENADMCYQRKQSLLDMAGQLGAQKSACEKVEMAKDRQSMATFRHYCNIDSTGHGVEKAPSRCGYVEIDCAACRAATIEWECASRDAEQLQCPASQVAK